jgi:Planctomycete cytochrome C
MSSVANVTPRHSPDSRGLSSVFRTKTIKHGSLHLSCQIGPRESSGPISHGQPKSRGQPKSLHLALYAQTGIDQTPEFGNCLELSSSRDYDSTVTLFGRRLSRSARTVMKIKVVAAAGLWMLAGSGRVAQAVDYLRDVKPILAERCYSCHGAIRQKAGLRLDTAMLIRRGGESGPAIEPGRSNESLLIERVAVSAESSDRMPPTSEGVPLGDHEIGVLRAWIDEGGKAPPVELVPKEPRRHWA